MPNPVTDALREMAAHRGLKLLASRRRKPGGDFGRYGLTDSAGVAVFGMADGALSADADAIRAFLRGAASSAWEASAETLPPASPGRDEAQAVRSSPAKREAAGKPPSRRSAKPADSGAGTGSEPPARRPARPAEPSATTGKAKRARPAAPRQPEPPPKPRFRPAVANLLHDLPEARAAEAFTDVLARPGVRVERIVSRGQRTPDDAPMRQPHAEWVLLLQGAAGIRVADSAVVALGPGDHLLIEPDQPHWVAWTASDRPTVWLAIHLTEHAQP
jgi:hypothetical protein